jgi:hypothetical protein
MMAAMRTGEGVARDNVGSAKAGPKVAAILSIVESCRRRGVPLPTGSHRGAS